MVNHRYTLTHTNTPPKHKKCTHKLLCHLCCYNSTITMQKPRENSLNSGCFKQKKATYDDKLLSFNLFSVLSCQYQRNINRFLSVLD